MAVRHLTEAQKLKARAALLSEIRQARKCPNAFIRFAAKSKGRRVIQKGLHVDIQNFLSKNDKAIIRVPVGCGKSSQITRWRVIWELGNDPNIRIGIVSVAKGAVPKKILDAIKQDIEGNERIRAVFPHLRPRQNHPHWKEHSIIVERSDNTPDPSVQTFGLFSAILGSRLDLVILDDIHDQLNTVTQGMRDKIFDWITGSVFSRQDSQTTMRKWFVGHRWHKDDTLQRLENLGWPHLTVSAFKKDPKTGREVSVIPHMHSTERLLEMERDLGVMAGPMLRNELSSLENTRFKQEWIDLCLQRGRGLHLVDFWDPATAPTFTGVDVSTGHSKDSTVIFTMAILPTGVKRVLDIRIGKFTGPDIIRQLVDVSERYGSTIAVESNAAQAFLHQFASDIHSLPIKRHVTGMNKHGIFGVESLAVEFERGGWALPNTVVRHKGDNGQVWEETRIPENVEKWIKDMLNHSPNPKEHTADTIMAAWICRECARESGYSHGTGLQDYGDFVGDAYLQWDTLVR